MRGAPSRAGQHETPWPPAQVAHPDAPQTTALAWDEERRCGWSMTAVLTATSNNWPTTSALRVRTLHHPTRALPTPVNRRFSALTKPRPQVIIVREPSAKAARRTRTGRYTPARSHSSLAHNDTPRQADTRPISVHTEEVSKDWPTQRTMRRGSVWVSFTVGRYRPGTFARLP